jgi:hypothetical protein
MTRSLLVAAALLAHAPQEKPDLKAILAREIIGPSTALEEVQAYLEARIPALPEVRDAAQWAGVAEKLRRDVLDQVVYRGEAARWRDLPARVEWAGDLAGGPGYRLRKLRYEAVPGLWVPAALYLPEPLSGKVPVHLAVNGHDGKGKAADYKQARCVNLAKRGMIVLNAEWVGMGQLRGPGYAHYAMNQLDLCGTSGLAPFYLSMKRGLDVLLSLEHADPARVAVHGLSGGGWQTIFISALDPRVTLANPVAGYSSFKTRVRHLKDLGDSEQTPCDLATVADYTHLTAMRAPRPTLLTFCAKDECCFEAGYALRPLVDAALPVFRLHGKESHLRTHVNQDPGTHNFLRDNREALYRLVGDVFFPGDASYDAKDIDVAAEIKTAPELDVELPQDNATFNSLAKALAAPLHRGAALPSTREAVADWIREGRDRLRKVLRLERDAAVQAEVVGTEEKPGLRVVYRKLRVDDAFTVPAVELAPPNPKATVLLFSESGRASLATEAERRLAAGERVVAIDPFYYGESRIARKDFLFALLVASVGKRTLGIQAAQVSAVARWAALEFKTPEVTVAAAGPRSSLVATAAAGLGGSASRLELNRPFGSLKEIVEQNLTVDKAPELFCFGLLREFDVKHLLALAADARVEVRGAGDRVRAELGEDLQKVFDTRGSRLDILP